MVHKKSAEIFFDMDFVCQLHNEIYAHNHKAIVDRKVFEHDARALVQNITQEQLFPNVEIDTYEVTEEPKPELTDFTLDELHSELLQDMLDDRDGEEAGGYVFTCAGYHGPNILPEMQTLVETAGWRVVSDSYDNERTGDEILALLHSRGKTVTPKGLARIVQNALCIRQICFYPELIHGLIIEKGSERVWFATPSK